MRSYLAGSHVYPREGNKKLVLKAREPEDGEALEESGREPGTGFCCFHKDLGGGIALWKSGGCFSRIQSSFWNM